MPEELPILDLNTIAGGSAFELFENELKKVLANILDENVERDCKREIVLTATFKPGEDRRSVAIALQAKCKLAPALPTGGVAFVGMRRGAPVATAYDMKQTQLEWDEADRPRSIPGSEKARTGTED